MTITLLDRITKEGEDNGYIPNTFIQVTVPYRIAKDLSVKCRCGFLLELNYKLTDLFCPNPYCFESNAYKVVKVFEKAHEKINIGQKTAEGLLLHNSFGRHMDVLTIEDINQFPNFHSIQRREDWINAIKEFRKNRSFAEYIEFFQLDNIGGTKCSYLFAGMSSVQELRQALDSDWEFRIHISKVLGYASENNRATWGVFNTLKTFLPIFEKYEPYFYPFKEMEGKVLFIALTGNFQEFRPRTRLLEWVRENYNLNPILVKYSSKAELLIYEEVNHSRQFDQAMSEGKAIHINKFLERIEHLRRDK